MNKRSLSLFCALFYFLFGVFATNLPVNKALAEDETDQFCEDAQITAGTNSLVITGNTLAQSFKPGTTTLTKIYLAIAMSTDTNKTVTLTLRTITGGDSVVATASTTGENSLIYWMPFSFDNLALDATKSYSIQVTTASTTARWYYSTAGCYSNGTATINGSADSGKDFGFFTQGHGVPPAENTNTETVVDTTIASPTKAMAEYVTDGNKVKVSWTK